MGRWKAKEERRAKCFEIEHRRRPFILELVLYLGLRWFLSQKPDRVELLILCCEFF